MWWVSNPVNGIRVSADRSVAACSSVKSDKPGCCLRFPSPSKVTCSSQQLPGASDPMPEAESVVSVVC